MRRRAAGSGADTRITRDLLMMKSAGRMVPTDNFRYISACFPRESVRLLHHDLGHDQMGSPLVTIGRAWRGSPVSTVMQSQHRSTLDRALTHGCGARRHELRPAIEGPAMAPVGLPGTWLRHSTLNGSRGYLFPNV